MRYVRNECEKCLRAAPRAFAASGMTQRVGVEHLSRGFTGTKGLQGVGGRGVCRASPATWITPAAVEAPGGWVRLIFHPKCGKNCEN